MKKTKLQKLELTSFRGASETTQVEFDPGKKVTMIFGENGTGKSSIVDGFSFVCEQGLGSLGERSGADKELVASIRGKAGTLRVTLTTDSGNWTAWLKPNSKSKVVVNPTSGFPDVRILRRSSILRLIEAEPSQRFTVLQEYLDVNQIERCEKNLGEAIRDKETEVQRKVQAFTQAEESLIQLWKSEGSVGVSAEEWAAAEAGNDLTTLSGKIKEADEATSGITDSERKKAAVDVAVARAATAEATYTKALSEQKNEETKVVGQNSALLTLLRQAQVLLKAHPSQVCPVCQQPADSEHLSEELTKRMAPMATLAKAATSSELQKQAFENAKAQLSSAETAFVEAAATAASDANASSLPPFAHSRVSNGDLSKLQDDTVAIAERLKIAAELLAPLTTLKPALKEFRDKAQKTVNQQAAIASQLQQLRKNRAGQEATSALLAKLNRALRIVAQTRKAFVTEVLGEISDEVGRLYAKLHPNEEIGGIRLSLDPRYVQSLYLHGDFHSAKGVAPQSLFSESHLDTLGLCVFVALAKRYKTEDTVIILDDVLTSVDSAHLDRFIELIHEEEQHFSQVILTTHYRPWRDRYRNHRAPGQKVHFIELRSWSLGAGIRIQGMRLSLDELKGTLTATDFDRQNVAAKAGIFLENCLEFLARVFVCRLPFTGQTSYTLRELSDCLSPKLLKALKVERLTLQKDATGAEQPVWQPTPLEPFITKVKGLAAVRNQVGAHFNDLGSLCTDAEVEELAAVAIGFGDVLVCSEGGDFPSRSQSGSYHESRSKKVRLHPFREPH